MSSGPKPVAHSFFLGTRADLKIGDMIKVGHGSNFLEAGALSWTYVSATMDAAIWGAELARGDGRNASILSSPQARLKMIPTLPTSDDRIAEQVAAAKLDRQLRK